MIVRFLRAAQAEFDEAMAMNGSMAPSLDEAFRADAIAKLEQIASYPQSSPELCPNIRRAAPRRFPFLIIYTVARDGIVVLAIAHMRRRPRTWRDRLKDV